MVGGVTYFKFAVGVGGLPATRPVGTPGVKVGTMGTVGAPVGDTCNVLGVLDVAAGVRPEVATSER